MLVWQARTAEQHAALDEQAGVIYEAALKSMNKQFLATKSAINVARVKQSVVASTRRIQQYTRIKGIDYGTSSHPCFWRAPRRL